MKRKLTTIFLFLFGVCLITFASGASILPKDKQYADYFLRMHAAELFRDRSFVLDKSWAYVSTTRLERVEMRFSCYKVLTVNQARKLIVDLATELVDKINADSKMREKHLLKDPFTFDRLKLEVRTNNVFSRNVDVTSVRVVLLNNGQITYETYTPSTLFSGSSSEYKETLEYAFMLLDDPALIEQVDTEIRSNWKKKEWKGQMYSPEQPKFMRIKEPSPLELIKEPFTIGVPVSENQKIAFGETPFVVGTSTHQMAVGDAPLVNFFSKEAEPTPTPVFEKMFPTQKTSLPNSLACRAGQVRPDAFFDIAPSTVVYGSTVTEMPLKNSMAVQYGQKRLETLDDMSREGVPSLEKVYLNVMRFPATSCAVEKDVSETSSWLSSGHSKHAHYTNILASNALYVGQDRHAREIVLCESTLQESVPSKKTGTRSLYVHNQKAFFSEKKPNQRVYMSECVNICPNKHPSVQRLCFDEEQAHSCFFDAPARSISMVTQYDVMRQETQNNKASPLEMTQHVSLLRNWIRSFISKGTVRLQEEHGASVSNSEPASSF